MNKKKSKKIIESMRNLLMGNTIKQKICVHCQKVFTCGYANTDKNECENYISSRMSKEEFEKKLWIKKQAEEMLEE